MSFGQSSEKLSSQIEQLELTLEELEGEAELVDAHKDVPATSRRNAPVRSLPPICPAPSVGSNPKPAAAPARIAAARFVRLDRTATRCSMWHRCSGASSAPFGPSIPAGPARRSSRQGPL
ncbi:hypothetical protein [Croceicoccus naphthovorans]|uniref:IS66 family transposase n=1 Tax=Croceicoccus naphthovorans TaxID=1348774 RepID=UPI00316AD6D9